MAISTKDFGPRFTDQIYAKKIDVIHSLNTSLIDNIWAQILNYRSQFRQTLSLFSISKSNYYLTYSPAIIQNINKVEKDLSNLLLSYLKLDHGSKEENKIRFNSYRYSLECYAKYLKEEVSPSFLNAVIEGNADNLQGLSENKKRIIAYYNGLLYLSEHISEPINVDLIVGLYSQVSCDEEITSLYRDHDFESKFIVSPIGREYNGAPYSQIERMMSGLYDFVTFDNHNYFAKACAIFYYINYVKPFDNFNVEVAMLAFKAVIAHNGLDSIASFLPLESILTHYDDLEAESKEVNRSNDMTYLLVKINEYINELINNVSSEISKEHADALEEENIEEPVEKESEEDTSKEEEHTFVNRSTRKETIYVSPKKESAELAMPVMSAGLDEKDAIKFEKYLIETYYDMKKSQAHFYARHCTIGSFYTIQMYKKSERVVYETARTSMDHLVELGLYEKKQYKNKYIYTPVKIK